MKNNLEILIYDPNFSSKGHYVRFSKYFLKLSINQNKIDKIIYFGKKLFNNKKILYKKIKHIDNNKGYHLTFFKKILYFKLVAKLYFKNILFINKFGKNRKLLLLSESHFIFQFIFILFYKYDYSVVVVTIKSAYSYNIISLIKKYIFFIFLKKASAIISLNKINQKKLNIFLNKKTFFVPERSI